MFCKASLLQSPSGSFSTTSVKEEATVSWKIGGKTDFYRTCLYRISHHHRTALNETPEEILHARICICALELFYS